MRLRINAPVRVGGGKGALCHRSVPHACCVQATCLQLAWHALFRQGAALMGRREGGGGLQ